MIEDLLSRSWIVANAMNLLGFLCLWLGGTPGVLMAMIVANAYWAYRADWRDDPEPGFPEVEG